MLLVSLLLHLASAGARKDMERHLEPDTSARGLPRTAQLLELMEACGPPHAISAFTRIAKLAFEQESEFANLDFDLDLGPDDLVQCT